MMGKVVKVKKTELSTGKETVYDSVKIATIRNCISERTIRRYFEAGSFNGYKWERLSE